MDITANESPEIDNEPAEKENEAEPHDQKISAQCTGEEKTKKSAQDARAKRKDEKTILQVLKTLDNLKTPEEKLVAMCNKYSELLHENRQLQSTVKQSEKTVNMLHREKEQFRNERSKAILAKTRMEQLCRELQKLNKAQQEETALKLKVEEEKRKEICFTFQGAFAEMNTLTNQSNEKSAKLREENLEMREKIKSVCTRIELTEKQLDMVRQEAKLELQLAREKYNTEIEKLKAEKIVLKADKRHVIWKLAQEKVERKEQDIKEEQLKKQLELFQVKAGEYALGMEEVNKLWTTSIANARNEQTVLMTSMKNFQKESEVWQQRWDKVTIEIKKMMMINEQRDAEILTMYKKLATLQDLCKTFQRERSSLIAQLRGKNDNMTIDSSIDSRKAMKQVEAISEDCENVKANLAKLGKSMFEAQKRSIRARNKEYTAPQEVTRKQGGKFKKGRNKSAPMKQEIEKDTNALAEGFVKFQQHKKLLKEMESLLGSRTDPLRGELEGTKDSTIDEMFPENECLEKASLDLEFQENESRKNKLPDEDSLENEYPEKEWLENEYSEEESVENQCPQKESLQNEYLEKESLENDCPEEETQENECPHKVSQQNKCLEKESLENDCPEKETPENECPHKESLENDCPEKETQENECPHKESLQNECLEKESLENVCPEKESLQNECLENQSLENDCPEKESLENEYPEKTFLENECPQKESLKNECPEKESAAVSDSAQLLATLPEKMENGTEIEDSCVPIKMLETPSDPEHQNKTGPCDA